MTRYVYAIVFCKLTDVALDQRNNLSKKYELHQKYILKLGEIIRNIFNTFFLMNVGHIYC